MRWISGFVITGGDPASLAGDSVEVYNPLTERTCWLYDLPDQRRYHSLCANLICGGLNAETYIYSLFNSYETLQSCLYLEPRVGRFYNTLVWLKQKREDHLCWEIEGEGGDILLLGGIHSPISTERVNPQGRSSSSSFRLDHNTM